MRRFLTRGALLFAAIYLLASAGLLVFQERLLFVPGKLAADHPFRLEVPVEEKFLDAGGDRIHALWIRPAESRGVFLHCHGNSGDLGSWSPLGEAIAKKLGMSVLLFDYPGFGKSGGNLRGEAQLHAASAAAFAEAGREAAGGPLIVYGRSMGSGLAARLASEHKVSALILETPYYSMIRLARDYHPWALPFLLRYPLRSDEWLPKVQAPVLALHGTRDEIIPFRHGEELARLNPRVKLVAIEGGTHNNLRSYAEYWAALDGFVSPITADFRRQGR